MAKVIPSDRTLQAAQAVLTSKEVNAELGLRAGMPQHEGWLRNVQQLREAVISKQPLSPEAIDGADAIYKTLKLGGIGLDYVHQGRPLPGLSAEQSEQCYRLHQLVSELRSSIQADVEAQRSPGLFAAIGKTFGALLS